MLKKIFIIIAIISGLISCEENVSDPNLPYEEKLVVYGLLEAGKPAQNISITKTLPPLDKYSQQAATIKNAVAFIRQGNKEDTLLFDGTTYYSNTLIPEIGKKYTIVVKWKEHAVSSSTVIPDTVNVDSFSFSFNKEKQIDWMGNEYEFWLARVYVNFIPRQNEVYKKNDNDGSGYYYGENVYTIDNKNEFGKIALPIYTNTYTIWENPDTNKIKKYVEENIQCTFNTFDQPYLNYHKTRYEGGGGDDIFGTSGVNVRGNIRGGIGIFVGMNQTVKQVIFD